MKFLSIALIALTVAGCAFSDVKKAPPDKYAGSFMREQAFIVPPDQALQDAKISLEAMGYEIQSFTPELNQVMTKAKTVLLPSTCDCGTWNSTEVGGSGTSFIRVQIQGSVAGQSTVALEHSCTAGFTGRNMYGGVTHQETLVCASRGLVEKQFWATYTSVLKSREAENLPQRK